MLSLTTYRIFIVVFQIQDKIEHSWVFQENFLLANNSLNIFLRISFLFFSNINIIFLNWELIYRPYTTTKSLLTTWQIKIVDRKTFAKVALDENLK